MRPPGVLALGVALIAAPPAPAQAPAPGEPVQRTVVAGTPPALGGPWLVVGRLDLPDGRTRTNVALWEVLGEAAAPALGVRFAALPPALQEALDRANAAGTAWTPRAAEVAAVARAWPTLPPREARVTEIETTISGRDGFDEELARDPRARDALWVIRQRETPAPGTGGPVEQVLVYAALERRRDGFAGNHTTVALAAAPFPVPIAFHGTFVMYSLDPRPGLLARVLAPFRGCGR
jgi:hypothetical protein